MNNSPQLDSAVAIPPLSHSLTVRFARTPAEVREAQRLRYAVFAGEMGAHLHTQTSGWIAMSWTSTATICLCGIRLMNKWWAVPGF
ncbi:MAG: hypothetical protein R3F37_17465 [Candidatus Competibacteraceae bacterium]